MFFVLLRNRWEEDIRSHPSTTMRPEKPLTRTALLSDASVGRRGAFFIRAGA